MVREDLYVIPEMGACDFCQPMTLWRTGSTLRAEDCISKPLSREGVLSRVRAALSRAEKVGSGPLPGSSGSSNPERGERTGGAG